MRCEVELAGLGVSYEICKVMPYEGYFVRETCECRNLLVESPCGLARQEGSGNEGDKKGDEGCGYKNDVFA